MEKAIRVLYIEDNLGMAELLRAHLEVRGFQVTLAESGESGLDLCAKEKFDVVLIDYALGELSGQEVVHQLVADDTSSPALIMVTGTGDEHIAVEAMKAGADDYVVKDVGGSYMLLLTEVIRKALNKRDLRRSQRHLQEEQERLIEDLQSFSYAVAHDLKQPLAVFSTSLGLLEHYIKMHDEKRITHRLTQMTDIVVKMSETIDALILLAQIRETNDISFNIVDTRQLVQNVCLQLADNISTSQATVIIPDEMPTAYGYLPWIEQIWINFLTNALKYGGTPPQIEFGAAMQDKNTACFWVKDNGKGLSPEERDRIFLPFARLSQDKKEGHGLGLAIVNTIVRKLGGELRVESTLGEGSSFGFILPISDEQ